MTREPDFNMPVIEVGWSNFNMPVIEVGWSTRVANVMELYGIKTLGNVARMTRSEWMRLPNISRMSVNEIEATLKEYGLWLGFHRAPNIATPAPLFQCPCCGASLVVEQG